MTITDKGGTKKKQGGNESNDNRKKYCLWPSCIGGIDLTEKEEMPYRELCFPSCFSSRLLLWFVGLLEYTRKAMNPICLLFLLTPPQHTTHTHSYSKPVLCHATDRLLERGRLVEPPLGLHHLGPRPAGQPAPLRQDCRRLLGVTRDHLRVGLAFLAERHLVGLAGVVEAEGVDARGVRALCGGFMCLVLVLGLSDVCVRQWERRRRNTCTFPVHADDRGVEPPDEQQPQTHLYYGWMV